MKTKKIDRRKTKPIKKERITVSIEIGLKEEILKRTWNLSSLVNEAIINYLQLTMDTI